jgi:hypothetical protein
MSDGIAVLLFLRARGAEYLRCCYGGIRLVYNKSIVDHVLAGQPVYGGSNCDPYLIVKQLKAMQW